MDVTNIGIIILAAGASTRLGKPKQLIKFRGKTLLEKSIETALDSKCQNISVILGANYSQIHREIKDFPVQILINDEWEKGMSSSLKFGLENLIKSGSKLDAAIVLLCDQPLISSKHIDAIIRKFNESQKPIIACQYKETTGVPALFSKKVFDKLLLIEGNKGARKIINDFPELVETIHFPEADFDIDTDEDLQKLRQNFESNL